MSEQPKPKRQIPVVLMVLVPLVTVGLAVAVVALIWRSSGSSGAKESPDPLVPADEATGVFLDCTGCHKDLDKVFKMGLAPKLPNYTHEMHFAKGVSECAVCHPANTHEPDRINKPTMSRCFICHGLGTNAIAPGQCETCHPPGMRQEPETHLAADWVPAAHSKAALEDRFECLTCHEEATCNSCHGLEMPHNDVFREETHPLVYFENPRLCESCHVQPPNGRDSCDSCHHPEGPKDTPWREFHPTAVTELGASTCFQCHSDQTCRTCHTKGIEDLSADEALLTAGPSGPSGG